MSIDIESRIAALAAKSAKPDARRAAFDALTKADPDQAAWLQEMAKEFGRPSAIAIRLQGQVIYESGVFEKADIAPLPVKHRRQWPSKARRAPQQVQWYGRKGAG